MLTSAKLGGQVLKGIFSETTYWCGVYLRAKFEVSSTILTSVREGGR